jgi:hypothetical protein
LNVGAEASDRKDPSRGNGWAVDGASTYQAVQAVAPGRLELASKPIRDPGPGEVRIRVGTVSRAALGSIAKFSHRVDFAIGS